MFPALLATVCFACSAICGQRLSRLLGGITANWWRLLLAFVILAALTLTIWPESIRRETAGWYFLSGLVGFGLGDVALFLAYPHLGSRLTVLVLMSFACLFGWLGDWMVLGERLTAEMAASILVILSGLFLALHRPNERLPWNRGLVFAIIAGFGQGAGVVLSHLAQDAARAQHFAVPALSQTAQRAFGGLLVSGVAFAVVQHAIRRRGLTEAPARKKNRSLWLVGSALFGPVIGVSAMQWAIEVLQNSALVIALTATAPLFIIPLARLVDREKSSRRAILGTAIAVAGVALAAFAREGKWHF